MKNLTKASNNELSILVMNDQSLVSLYSSNHTKFFDVLSKNYRATKNQFETLLLDLLGLHPQGLKVRHIMTDFEAFKEQLELDSLPIIQSDLEQVA